MKLISKLTFCVALSLVMFSCSKKSTTVDPTAAPYTAETVDQSKSNIQSGPSVSGFATQIYSS